MSTNKYVGREKEITQGKTYTYGELVSQVNDTWLESTLWS